MIPPFDTILTEVNDRLLQGAASRHSPMHTPVVGTADGDLRVMVLREYDPATRVLRFHTDARSPKVPATANNPLVNILFYDAEARVQIRAKGTGRTETSGPVADAAWAGSTPFAKRCYLSESPPSADSDQPVSGLPEWVEGITPTEEQVAPGRENFAVLLVELNDFDWLHLANSGHRRARFRFASGASAPEANWLLP